jgi:dihydropyrimidine dehydrogenase (NADP+)
MLELNLSCPHGMTELGMGRACGENPDVVREICKWVTSEIDLPVIVKITPNYPDSAVIA